MKEIKIHYFVPENTEELESLVGKTVGVKCGNNFFLRVLFPLDRGYEFLQQDGSKIIGGVVEGWDKSMSFDNGEFKVDNGCWFLFTYVSNSEGYNERRESLKANGLWEKLKE